MDQQKCRICGDRHRLGPCPPLRNTPATAGARLPGPTRKAAAAPRRIVVSGKEAISYPIGTHDNAAANTLGLAESFATAKPKAPRSSARKRAEAVEGQTHATHHLRSLAPEGECRYCDYRRVAAARSMRTRRAKDKKATRRAKQKGGAS